MNYPIIILNLTSIVFLLAAAVVVLIRKNNFLSKPLMISAALLLITATITNVVEHTGVTLRFDYIEDILKVLFFPIFIFAIYSSLITRALNEKTESERQLYESREQQQKARLEMQHHKEELQKIMDQSLDLICRIDATGILMEVNAASERLLGYQPFEMIGKKYIDFVHQDDLEKTMKLSEIAATSTEITNFQNRFVHKDGTQLPLIWSSKWSTQDNIWYSIAKDATEINKAKKRIKESELKLKKAQSIAKIGGWEWNMKNNHFILSDQVYTILNLDKVRPFESYESVLAFVHPEDRMTFDTKVKKVLAEDIETFDLESRFLLGDKVVKYLHLKGNLEKTAAGRWFSGTIQDITDRKIAEKKNEQLQGIFENYIHETCLVDAQTLRYQHGNQEALQNMGYTLEQLTQLTLLDIIPQLDEAKVRALLKPLYSREKNKIIFEAETKRSNGNKYPTEVHVKLIDKDEKPVLLLVTLDITERRNREKQLKISNQRFQLAMKAANEALWEWNLEDNSIIWSEGYEKIFLRSAKEDSHLETWQRNIFRHDKEDVIHSVMESLNHSETNLWQRDYRYIRGDHSVCWVEARGYIVRDDNGNPIKMIGAMMDITERKTFQEKLMESIIETQEQERNRVAKDLHDGIVQELVACGMKAELIRLTQDDDKRSEGLNMLLDQIKRTTNDVRNLSHGLLSADVHNMNLSGLIERLIFQLNSISPIDFIVNDKLSDPVLLDDEVKINLYRAVQEITSNIIKHSKARNAIICMECARGEIRLSIKDDGIGMHSDIKKSAGIGMYNIENRIKKIGGTVEYLSPLEGGLQTNIKVAL